MAGADPLEPSMEAYVRLAEVPGLWIFGLPRERGVNLYRMKAMYFEVYLLQQPILQMRLLHVANSLITHPNPVATYLCVQSQSA